MRQQTSAHTPTVSVIIPAYNESEYIDRCLDAIQKQTVKANEIIVVDNNSTDETAAIAQRFQNVRVVKEYKRGPSAARNTGAARAKNELLIFLDADCVAPPAYIKQILHLMSDPARDGVGGPYVHYDAGTFLQWLSERTNFLYWVYTINRWAFGIQGFATGNFAIRKHIYDAVGGCNENLTNPIMAEDIELAVRLSQHGHHIYYDPNLKVLSSFRRFKVHAFQTTLRRLRYAYTYVLHAKVGIKLNSQSFYS